MDGPVPPLQSRTEGAPGKQWNTLPVKLQSEQGVKDGNEGRANYNPNKGPPEHPNFLAN